MSNPSNRKDQRNAKLYKLRVRDRLTWAALGRLFKISPSTAALLFSQTEKRLAKEARFAKPYTANQLFLQEWQDDMQLLTNLRVITLQFRLIAEPLANGQFARKRKNRRTGVPG